MVSKKMQYHDPRIVIAVISRNNENLTSCNKWDSKMLLYISVAADLLAAIALIVSLIFLLKELRLTRDSIRHSDFVSSINRSAENMLRITENNELLDTIQKISIYRNQPQRNSRQLKTIINNLAPREQVRYLHFQRNACLSCEVFLESSAKGFIDADSFAMAFGWNEIDFEIWNELSLNIGAKTRKQFEKTLAKPASRLPVSLD